MILDRFMPGRLLRAVVTLALVCPLPALAHEMRPAYLELRQTGPETYDTFWKLPRQAGDPGAGLHLKFPAQCTSPTAPRVSMVNGARIERRGLGCPGGLDGATIGIAGLGVTVTDLLVRVESLDGAAQITRLTAAEPSFRVRSSPDRWQVMRAYSVLGIEHILTGVDHLLFVLALIIITRGGWNLVRTVTAFTFSHSITLTAATLGFVHVPQQPVEAVIALSILFVAVEIIQGYRGRTGITARAPWLVALTFGLLHGLGFAGGLSDAGLPQAHIPLALLFFSLGVETGHFLFVGMVISAASLSRQTGLAGPAWARWVPPYAIGSLAMFWLIQRMAAF